VQETPDEDVKPKEEDKTPDVSVKPDTAVETDEDEAPKRKKPNKAVVIVVDILVIAAVVVVVCFAILRLAPDSGVSELIWKGFSKVMQLTDADSGAAEVSASNNNGEYVMPISDGDTLVSSQLFNNYNIGVVRYDPSASWKEGVEYPIAGADVAKPIENDLWTTNDQGQLLYDESAVAAVIRFNSELMDYIANKNVTLLNELTAGGEVEKKLADYVANVSAVNVESLGIGNIRKEGDNLYVWTNEIVTETRNGVPEQRAFMRLYLLAPGDGYFTVSDFADLT
jgi:hypothetical protein